MSAPDDSDSAARRHELEGRNAALRSQIDTMLSDLRKQTEDLREKQAEAAQRTHEVSSDDGMITARVDATGTLQELELSPKAFDRSAPDRLAREITSVIREATGEARQSLQADFVPTDEIPDLSDMVPGLPSISEFLHGNPPVAAPEPAEERAKRGGTEPAKPQPTQSRPAQRATDDDEPPDSFLVGGH